MPEKMPLAFEVNPFDDLCSGPVVDNRAEYRAALERLQDLLKMAGKHAPFQIEQYGKKTGQLYIEHAIDGIMLILQWEPVFFRPPVNTRRTWLAEFKVCVLSYLIHDLNKIYSLPATLTWNASKVVECLASLNEGNDLKGTSGYVDAFFPEWRDYVNDMMVLINGHSTIYNHNARALFVSTVDGINPELRVQLSKDVLSEYARLMQVIDLADLIHDINATRYEIYTRDDKDEWHWSYIDHAKLFESIRLRISSLLRAEKVILPIRVITTESVCSNVILNAAVDECQQNDLRIIPFLSFPTGVLVIAARSDLPALTAEFVNDLAKKVSARLRTNLTGIFEAKISDQDFAYKKSNNGIVLKDIVFMEPNVRGKIGQVLATLKAVKNNFAFNPDNPASSPRFKNTRLLGTKYLALSPASLSHPLVARWSNAGTDLLGNDQIWAIGRYVHTIYNVHRVLNDRYNGSKLRPEEMMKRLLVVLGIFGDVEPIYDQAFVEQVNKKTREKKKTSNNAYWYLYDAISFLIGDVLVAKQHSLEDVASALIEDTLSFYDEVSTAKRGSADILTEQLPELVKESISFFDLPLTSDLPVGHTGNACSICGKSLNGSRSQYVWTKEYIPYGYNSTKFSNFQPASGAKPYRLVCHVCRLRYLIEKIYAVEGEFDIYRALFFYPRGVSYNTIRAHADRIRTAIATFNDGVETAEDKYSSVVVDLRDYDPDNPTLKFTARKKYGFIVPQRPEEYGGALIYPHAIKSGSKIAEEYLGVMGQVMLWASKLRLKFCLSKFTHDGVITSDSRYHGLLEDVPIDLGWLYGEKTMLTKSDVEHGIAILDRVRSLASKTHPEPDRQKETEVEILRTLKNGLFATIHYLDVRADKNIRDAIKKKRIKTAQSPDAFIGNRCEEMLQILSTLLQERTQLGRLPMIEKEQKMMDCFGRMARLRIKGDDWSQYAKSKPFDILMSSLRESAELPPEARYANAKQKIARFIEQSSFGRQHKGKWMGDKAEAFVDSFQEGVNATYKGKIANAIQDENVLRSVYLWAVHKEYKKEDEPKDSATPSKKPEKKVILEAKKEEKEEEN